jgi:hypothetical protein
MIRAYTIVDADSGERFVSEDFLCGEGEPTDAAKDRAERRREELVIEHGKEFCLEVRAIDQNGDIQP